MVESARATLRDRAAATLQRSWEGRGALSTALLPAAAAFGAIVAARRQLFARGLRESARLPVPVVVVGNLVVGGAGKTPTTIAVVESLRRGGYTPGIVSRGYGRTSSGIAIVSPEASAQRRRRRAAADAATNRRSGRRRRRSRRRGSRPPARPSGDRRRRQRRWPAASRARARRRNPRLRRARRRQRPPASRGAAARAHPERARSAPDRSLQRRHGDDTASRLFGAPRARRRGAARWVVGRRSAFARGAGVARRSRSRRRRRPGAAGPLLRAVACGRPAHRRAPARRPCRLRGRCPGRRPAPTSSSPRRTPSSCRRRGGSARASGSHG